MKRNIGTVDRVIRLLLAIVIAVLYQIGVIKGTLGIVLIVIAVIFLLTSIAGFCPLYALLGISTKKTQIQAPTAATLKKEIKPAKKKTVAKKKR